MNRFISILIGLFCVYVAEADSRASLYVVTTTGMIADTVRNVGGESVRVDSLMGTGVDPHLYNPTHGDMQKLRDAQIIFYNGLHLEGKMSEVLEKIAKSKPVFAVAEAIDKKLLIALDEQETQFDPHVWFDVMLWVSVVEEVTKRLTEALPDKSKQFEEASKKYKEKLIALDANIKERLSQIPSSQRVLVTAHDAFSYFGKAYGVEVMGLQGVSTESEFGLHDLKRISEIVIERKVKSIFIESSVPKRFISALQEGLKEKGYAVSIGTELYSDAMGPEGTVEGTYIGMVQHNLDAIAKGLQ